ncbi:MAG: Fe-S-containing protein, partial [Spirochaetes bacterium]|nr:Fe-S-containing protein [Spirochaetota bacterium]
LAVRAPDATIRTALNTCQICYSSGRGFYTQQGDVLVCNNCGNRFKVSQVERIKGGCNPVPITGEWKTEEADFIVISKAFLEQAKPLFLNWKKR